MRVLLALFFFLVIGSGCASSEETANGPAERERPAATIGFAPTASGVGTVQLFRTGDEASLALLPLETGETLTLAFDVIGEEPRPLSVWFYHADRSWRRDLVPAEYLDGFHNDDLFDYATSRATQVRYVHYRYEFPNRSFSFRVSGNYVLRVTEQGLEEDVLLERPFFVSEQGVPLDFAIDQVMMAGAAHSFLQPTVVFTPPPTAAAFDYSVCFVRNGRSDTGRCADRPSLGLSPALEYYLEPEESFPPQPEDHVADVSAPRVGPGVESVDLTVSPYLVVLEPDYLRFPGTPGAALQNGNPVVDGAVRDLVEPSTSAEYMTVRFVLEPDPESPVRGSVYLLGSFNDWRAGPASRMRKDPRTGRFEADVLLKQGRHEYRYGFDDQALAREVALESTPRLENLVSAFVYYRDVGVGTDRLITAVTVFAR